MELYKYAIALKLNTKKIVDILAPKRTLEKPYYEDDLYYYFFVAIQKIKLKLIFVSSNIKESLLCFRAGDGRR